MVVRGGSRSYWVLVASFLVGWGVSSLAETVTVPLTLIPHAGVTNELTVTLDHTGLGAGRGTDTTVASGTISVELDLDLTDPTNAVPIGFRFIEDTPGQVTLSNLVWTWSYLGTVTVTATNLLATGRTEHAGMEALTATEGLGEYTFLTDSNPVVLNRGIVTSSHWLLGAKEEANLAESPLVARTTNETGHLFLSSGTRAGLSVTFDVATDMPIAFSEAIGEDNTLIGTGVIAATGTVAVTLSDFDGDGLADVEDPDDDNDDLPDTYEDQFAELSRTNAADALLDPDGDTMITIDEYIAGTNPTNENEFLSLDWDGIDLGVDSFIGRVYFLQASTTLATGSWVDVSAEVAGTDSWLSFTNGADIDFINYRLGVKLD